ncbi:UbiA family prenyltransferase, partial [Candidatus Saccharibacteria bacterium]|nr:UbiA family prenyltransferase [Candidatus Saccharibacteria bacterium]
MAAGLLISRGNFQAEFWLAALAYVLAHSLVTLWNDIADETVDGLNGTPRIFQLRKQVSAKYIRMMLWLLTASLVACLVPVPWVVRGILLTFMVLGWLYNQKPAQLSRRPLGSMVVMFLAYG